MEITFRIIEIIVSISAVAVVIFGWIIPYKQSLKTEAIRKENEEKAERIRWKKDLIDRQISELYGPLDQIIRESNITFDLILFQLGRRFVFEKGRSLSDMPENEQKIWKHYVDGKK